MDPVNLDIALVGIRASNLAYELDSDKRRATLVSFGLTEVRYVEGANDARAICCTRNSDGLRVLAPQGTQFSKGQLPSIMENVKVIPVDIGGGCDVVAGYWQQTQALRSLLDDFDPDLITGHSMGGDIASHLAVTWKTPKFLYTYGSPKCANNKFWEATKVRPTRIVRERDFAPVWPYFPDEWEQPNQQQWIHNAAFTELYAARPLMPDSVPDHDPDLYQDDVTAIWGAKL